MLLVISFSYCNSAIIYEKFSLDTIKGAVALSFPFVSFRCMPATSDLYANWIKFNTLANRI